MISALVRTCGLRAAVIPDEELQLDRELLRARRIAVSDDELAYTLGRRADSAKS